MILFNNHPPIWRYSIYNFTIETPKETTIWFRFWTRFFFGGKWTRLNETKASP